MVNFVVDPMPFLPPGVKAEDGGNHRIPQAVVNLAGNVLHAHHEYILAIDILQNVEAADMPNVMNHVRVYITNAFHIPVRSVCRHPFGNALYQLDSAFDKDLVMAGNVHDINGSQVSFTNHDHALNRTNWDYSRYGSIMLLGYPLDYRNLVHNDQVIASFGKMVIWTNNGRDLGYVLVKCLYTDPQTVPWSLVLKQGGIDGTGWNWMVPVYILNWEHLNEWHADMDDLPPDGNPHPVPLPPQDDEIDQARNLADQFLQNF
jgi:hypothetical protein